MRPRTAASLIVLLLLAGCGRLFNDVVPTAGLAVDRDVPFGDLPRDRMDVYRPADGRRHPVVVFLYGGAWQSGSRGMYRFVGAALARRGFVVAIPDYRLVPGIRYPVFVQDCARAVAHVQRHAADWGGDPARVAVMGHSAGGYNAAMIATDPRFLADAGGSQARLAGFVGLAGPYDFLPITDRLATPAFPDRDDPATMPVNHIVTGRYLPPVLAVAGRDDEIVRPYNSESLVARARAAGHDATLALFPHTGHIGLILDFHPLFQRRQPVLATVAAWLDRLPPAAAGGAPPAAATRPGPARPPSGPGPGAAGTR